MSYVGVHDEYHVCHMLQPKLDVICESPRWMSCLNAQGECHVWEPRVNVMSACLRWTSRQTAWGKIHVWDAKMNVMSNRLRWVSCLRAKGLLAGCDQVIMPMGNQIMLAKDCQPITPLLALPMSVEVSMGREAWYGRQRVQWKEGLPGCDSQDSQDTTVRRCCLQHPMLLSACNVAALGN